MGYQIYQMNGRDCGYGVPAVCEYPNCEEEIDRGLAHVCGGTPDGEYGCHLYFCEKHLEYAQTDSDETVQVCDQCAWNIESGDGGPDRYREPYPEKPDVLRWVLWKLMHYSWAEWRENNSDDVLAMWRRFDDVKHSEIERIAKELESDGLYEKAVA